MSFLDKAKQAAAEMAAKADAAMSQAGVGGQGLTGSLGGGHREADAVLRDYGLLTWREQTGHPVDGDDKARVLAAIQALEGSGSLAGLTVTPAAPTPPPAPPPPGGAAAAPTQESAAAPPPPPEEPAPPSTQSGGGTTPPPPPPSWA